jgi:rubrerythrin
LTPKELLYLEDSLSMEQQLQTKCNDYASKIQDTTLKNALTQLATQHEQHYNCLLSQLNKQ